MQVFEGDSYTSLLKQVVSMLIGEGREVAPRGKSTREIQQALLILRTPSRRFPRLGGRNANIFALSAETIWVISGRNDLAFIEAYLPRMADFSDDGATLHGAYGPRMRAWQGVDQLRSVVDTLDGDPFSRRAVIALFDPAVDHDQGKKDIPCCTQLQFTSNQGRIDMAVYSRSMDIMWGSAINFFEWTTLQEAVAFWLSLPVGQYSHFVGSLHIYDEFTRRAARFSKEPEPDDLGATQFDITLQKLDSECDEYFRIEALYRAGNFDATPVVMSEWMAEAITLNRAFWMARRERNYQGAREVVSAMRLTEASCMALEQLSFMERQ